MILYKYTDEKGAIKIIKENSVLLKTPSEFNDPFDSVFYVNKENMNKSYNLYVNHELFKKFYNESIVGNNKPNAWGKEIVKKIKQDIPTIKKAHFYKELDYLRLAYGFGLKVLNRSDLEQRIKFHTTMKNIASSLQRIALVSCFSTCFDSVLMWSHYGDEHKGACIEFEVEDKDFRQVAYAKELPIFNLAGAMEIIFGHEFVKKEIDTSKKEFQFLLQPIFTKSDIWSYENEVRCVYSKTNLDSKIYERIDDDGKKTLLRMPPIKRIFVGCNASEKFLKEIKEVANNIQIIRLKTQSEGYGLEINKK